MYSIHLSGPGLLAVLFVLTFVSPFVDLPFSRRLQANPTAAWKASFYRWITVYLWLLALGAWVVREGAGLHVPHAPGELSWIFGARWRTSLTGTLVAAFLGFVLMPGIACLLQPRRIPAYTRAMKRLRWLLPHDAEQRRWFALLSVTAGVCEEWIFRGVVLHGLHAGMGFSMTAALVLSSLLFGWNHLYQGWSAIAGSAAIGFALGLLALLTNGLVVPMVLHALLDLQVVVSFRPDARGSQTTETAGG